MKSISILLKTLALPAVLLALSASAAPAEAGVTTDKAGKGKDISAEIRCHPISTGHLVMVTHDKKHVPLTQTAQGDGGKLVAVGPGEKPMTWVFEQCSSASMGYNTTRDEIRTGVIKAKVNGVIDKPACLFGNFSEPDTHFGRQILVTADTYRAQALHFFGWDQKTNDISFLAQRAVRWNSDYKIIYTYKIDDAVKDSDLKLVKGSQVQHGQDWDGSKLIWKPLKWQT